MEFGTNLKKVLEEMGVTQRELANRMGKEETYISRIINNRYNVSWRMINDIANALDISPACFFTENQDELFKILLNELLEDLLEFLQSRKNQAWKYLSAIRGTFNIGANPFTVLLIKLIFWLEKADLACA